MRVLRGISRLPSSGSNDPIITFISVDLPAPLRPMSPMRLLGGSAAVARSRIVRPPRRTVIPFRLSMMAARLQHFGPARDDELRADRRARANGPRFDGAEARAE